MALVGVDRPTVATRIPGHARNRPPQVHVQFAAQAEKEVARPGASRARAAACTRYAQGAAAEGGDEVTTRTDADRSALIPEAGMAASVDALVVRGAEPPGEPASAASAVQRIRDAIFVGTDPDPGWPTPDHPECVRRADLVLAALTNAGLVVVPREPTDAMMDAAMNSGQAPLCDGEIRTIWGVMIGDGRLLGHD